jgi:bifunctional DNA-binding transcriptional regulator/antitoxin component of YhaV-PrlF toxin-antitoxin module
MTIQVAQRGLLTLPKVLREAYNIQEGDQLTLLDLGGVFVISPQRSEIDRLADRLKATLQALREARQEYGA